MIFSRSGSVSTDNSARTPLIIEDAPTTPPRRRGPHLFYTTPQQKGSIGNSRYSALLPSIIKNLGQENFKSSFDVAEVTIHSLT